MTPAGPIPAPDAVDLDGLAVSLVQQGSLLTRLVFSRVPMAIPRSELGILARLEDGPQRITAIGEREGLAQPTVTLIVKRLEAAGLVARRRDAVDGRVVLVSITDAGREAIADARQQYRGYLSALLANLSDTDRAALARAAQPMANLLDLIQTKGLL